MKSMRRRIAVSCMAGGLLFVLGASGCSIQQKKKYQAFAAEAESAEAAYAQSTAKLQAAADSIPEAELLDTKLIQQAADLMKEAPDTTHSRFLEFLYGDLEYPVSARDQEELIQWYQDQTTLVMSLEQELYQSHDQWLLEQEKATLETILKEAENLQGTVQSKVMDAGLLDQLTDAIQGGRGLLTDGADLQSVKDAETTLKSLITQTKSSYSAYQEDQKRKEMEEKQSENIQTNVGASANTQTSSASENIASPVSANIWYVSYSNAYHTSEAAADGSITQWEDGYFIAHDWSANGKKIRSCPKYVNVNGQTYQFVSCKWVGHGTTWDQVSGFVHQNNGIGFQTCDGNSYFISHYEPI